VSRTGSPTARDEQGFTGMGGLDTIESNMVQKSKHYPEDRGISPVIGVILMVAVTVVLGAVIAAFVFGIGLSEPAPDTRIEMETMGTGSDAKIVMSHDGGETISSENTGEIDLVFVNNQSKPTAPWASTRAGAYFTVDLNSDTLSSGDSVEFTIEDGNQYNPDPGDELAIVWRSPDFEDTVVLARHEIRSDYPGA